MYHYRIFISEPGGFRISSNYEFVAEFPDKKMTANYIHYMSGKKRYCGKVIIIKEVDATGFSAKDGRVDGLISALGEELHVEEFEFV